MRGYGVDLILRDEVDEGGGDEGAGGVWVAFDLLPEALDDMAVFLAAENGQLRAWIESVQQEW